MNILKEKLSDVASKRAYTAPAMEVVVMDHHMDLLQGSSKASDYINQLNIVVEEE